MYRIEGRLPDGISAANDKTSSLARAAEELRRFLASARGWRVTLAEAGPFSCLSEDLELEVRPAKLILTIRGSERIWTRRILAYQLVSERALRLLLGRHGRGAPLTALIAAEPDAATRSERRVHRHAFVHAFNAALARAFPGARLLRLRGHPADSPLYLRRCLQWGARVIAVVGLVPDAGSARGHGLLSTGLIWYDRLRRNIGSVTDLYLMQGQARTSTTRRRLRHVHMPGLRMALFDMQKGPGDFLALRRVSLPPKSARPSGPERAAWPKPIPYRTGDLLLRVIDLAPTLIRRHARPEGYDSLRLRGLEFARAGGRRREVITFGILGARRLLTAATWTDLERLVGDLLSFRQAASPNPRHPFYARQPERWLESLIVDDIRRLAPELDPRYVYPQVPVCLGDRRGIADIVTIDSAGRLVVIEIKASEDRDLPLQGLDYWSAVAWHHQRHEFQRRGYFQGVTLSPKPPRLYLVAPLLRLHKAYRVLTSCIDPALDPVVLGINLDWRRQLKVLQRFCVNK